MDHDFELNGFEKDDLFITDDNDFSQFQPIEKKPAAIGSFIKQHRNLLDSLGKYRKYAKKVAIALIAIGYIIYFGFAMSDQFGAYPFPFPNGNYILFILTLITVIMLIWEFVIPRIDRQFSISRQLRLFVTERPWIEKFVPKIVAAVILLATIVVLLLYPIVAKDNDVIKVLAGYLIIMAILFVTSESPQLVNWRIVLSGQVLQFWCGVLVMRTSFGFDLVNWIAGRVEVFLNFSREGAQFIFGADLTDQSLFVIIVPAVIVFMGAAVSLFYHLGVMQYIISKIAWLLMKILGSTASTSINTAGNIFLGQTEAPMLIKPFMSRMTDSELFAVMVGGFASVSGSVLGTFITFGVSPVHLITACFMTAPGALALSNLAFPERHKTQITIESMKSYKSDATSSGVVDAISTGAMTALRISGAIIASLIAFISLLALADSLVNWIFSMVHQSQIDFQQLIAYVFYPFAFLLGVNTRDCMIAGRLFGVKTILNEFIAFQQLGELETLRNELIANGTFKYYDCGEWDWTSKHLMFWEKKSITVMTYALCGFANISSIGIQVGGLSVLAPDRKGVFSKYVVKAMIVACVSNIITAAFASLLYTEPPSNYTRNCSLFVNTPAPYMY